jgi:predicted O-methyltransferase YrrM
MVTIDEVVHKAEHLHGLCTNGLELRRLAELASNAEFVAEIGCYMGRSSMALTATNGIVYCVDTWNGSEEDPDGEKTKIAPMSEVYKSFVKNLWNEITAGKVIHLRCDSLQAAEIFKELGYTFDLIFIDAGHDYEYVTADIKAWLPLLDKGGVMIGHDLPHPRMVEALDDCLTGWTASVGMMWEYLKK